MPDLPSFPCVPSRQSMLFIFMILQNSLVVIELIVQCGSFIMFHLYPCHKELLCHCLSAGCAVFLINLLKCLNKIQHFLPAVRAVGAENTWKIFLTIKGNPCKLSRMVVQKPGSETDPFAGCYIGQRIVVVRTVKIVYMDIPDDTLLDSFKRIGGSSAYHEGSAGQIFLTDDFFFGQRIRMFRDQEDPDDSLWNRISEYFRTCS